MLLSVCIYQIYVYYICVTLGYSYLGTTLDYSNSPFPHILTEPLKHSFPMKGLSVQREG